MLQLACGLDLLLDTLQSIILAVLTGELSSSGYLCIDFLLVFCTAANDLSSDTLPCSNNWISLPAFAAGM